MSDERYGSKAGRNARMLAELAEMDLGKLDEDLRNWQARKIARERAQMKEQCEMKEDKRLYVGIDHDLPPHLRPASADAPSGFAESNGSRFDLAYAELRDMRGWVVGWGREAARARASAESMFFGVFLALGLTAVLLAAVLFDLSSLHGKLDLEARASAAAPSVLSMEGGPAPHVPPASPLFPPVIVGKPPPSVVLPGAAIEKAPPDDTPPESAP